MYRTTSLFALGLFLGLAPVAVQAQTQPQQPAQQQQQQMQEPAQQDTQQQTGQQQSGQQLEQPTLQTGQQGAQEQPAQQEDQQQAMEGDDADEQERRIVLQDQDSLLVGSVMGASVYSQDDEEIGDIRDMIVGMDGNVEGVVIGVGGFLGMGEKDVAMQLNTLSVATTGDGEVRLILNATKEELEAAPEFRSAADQADDDDAVYGTQTQQDMRADQETTLDQQQGQQIQSAEKADRADETTAEAPAEQDTAEQPETQQDMTAQQDTAEQPEAEQEMAAEEGEEAEGQRVQGQIVMQDENSVLASSLIGSAVYSENDDEIGDISDMIVQLDGKVEGIVIGVGGFLGIGEKDVVLPMDRFQIQHAEAGEEPRLVLSSTKEELQGAPEFKQPQGTQQQ